MWRVSYLLMLRRPKLCVSPTRIYSYGVDLRFTEPHTRCRDIYERKLG